MRKETELALEEINQFVELIKQGEKDDKGLKDLFQRLSERDYRDQNDIKLEYYLENFANGCMRERMQTGQETDRTPKMITVKDIEYFVSKFITESYPHVQQRFWFEYKAKYNRMYDHQKEVAISPKQIYDKIKELKNATKNN